MKISTCLCPTDRILGGEKAVECVAKAGFDAWDFSLFDMCKYDWRTGGLIHSDHPLAGPDDMKLARRMKQVGLDNGIHCNQAHAPFPTYCGPIRDLCPRALELASEAGAEICVVHPDNYKSPEENAEMYAEMMPYAHEYGVKIATENMFGWDDTLNQATPHACATPDNFNKHLDMVNDPFFVACLDIGHAELKGIGTSAVEMIRALGPRMQALHIHDNDCWHDSHQIPFSMNIDFEAVVKALAEVGYNGYFTLEADSYLTKFSADEVWERQKDLAKAARRLADMFEAYQGQLK